MFVCSCLADTNADPSLSLLKEGFQVVFADPPLSSDFVGRYVAIADPAADRAFGDTECAADFFNGVERARCAFRGHRFLHFSGGPINF